MVRRGREEVEGGGGGRKGRDEREKGYLIW